MAEEMREHHELISSAVHITGLAEVLYLTLIKAERGEDGNSIDDASNISWGYEALAELAKKLADEISDYQA